MKILVFVDIWMQYGDVTKFTWSTIKLMTKCIHTIKCTKIVYYLLNECVHQLWAQGHINYLVSFAFVSALSVGWKTKWAFLHHYWH